ncbi:MAG TPA: hypothetical protein VHU84_05230, partial [Lacipirellulaceae bacterium]|nr:hypothetical protein [Lacipirellulaceae bacterium]
MSAPLPTSGARLESPAWQELEDVFATLGQLARSTVAPPEFYRSLLDHAVRALSAAGGVAWLRVGSGSMQPAAQIGRAATDIAQNDDARRAHEGLLLEAMSEVHVFSVAPHTVSEEHPEGANLTDHLLVFAPIKAPGIAPTAEGQTNDGTTHAIIELWLQQDTSPAMRRGCEQFLTAVSELAADYHAFYEL